MNFLELINKVNSLDVKDKNAILEIVNNININADNYNQWLESVFSEKVKSFDMKKLPYLIDILYRTNDKMKFILCCMLIQASCDKLEFITNLEDYPMFSAKFEELADTLVTVYEHVDNGVANCMSLIIIKNDPKFKYFDDKLKKRLIEATKRKLNNILEYLKTENINPVVFNDLEVIVDMACYLKNEEISKLIDEIDNTRDNDNADIFIIKYKIINDLKISNKKIETISNKNDKLFLLYKIMEELNVHNIYLKNITQEKIAMSDMVRWLSFPTELGSIPDKIELLGEFNFSNNRFFAFKFSKEGYRIKGDLLGISGGYPVDKVSSTTSGFTFSKFEVATEDWQKQSIDLSNFIANYWKDRADSKK